jgi:hypothetical protein
MKSFSNLFKNMMGLKKIGAVVIGLILFILIVILGFQVFGTRAADVEPRDVTIADISQNSASVSWTTGVETQAVIEYGTSPTALNFFAPEATRTKNHKVVLTLLSPATTYYFQIRIGDKKYDNGGVPWTFTTKSTQTNETESRPKPTEALYQSTATPTPIQVLEINNQDQSTPNQAVCSETDCDKIKLNLGKGCTTQDYFRCIRKLTPTAGVTPMTTLAPTTTSTPSATPAP